MRVRGLLMAFTVLLALAPALPAAAQTRLGVRGGVYTDESDAFLGVELLTKIDRQLYFNPNVEYVFVDGGKFVTFNADVHYDFHTHSRAYAWLGGGLGVLYSNPDGPGGSDTKVGANFIGGVGLKGGDVIPYIQAKVVAASDSDFVLAFGLRF